MTEELKKAIESTMTEELKKAIKSATTKEEKKVLIEKLKEEIKKLEPSELDEICGGSNKPGWMSEEWDEWYVGEGFEEYMESLCEW